MFRSFSLFVVCAAGLCSARSGLAEAPTARTPAEAARSAFGVSGSSGLYEATLAAKFASERLHHYQFVEFPRLVRELDGAIRLAEAEVAVLAARAESYRPFRSFNQYSVTYTAAQDVHLRLLAASQRLRSLRSQRERLSVQRRTAIRALRLEQAAAVKRMIALRPDDGI